MGKSLSVEIVCSACGADTLVKRVPKYDGFKKIGEIFVCASCGHEFEDEDKVPFKTKAKPAVFDESDRSKKVEVFAGNEKARNCRYCCNYVVNPFTQRCSLHNKIVEATDICADFEQKSAAEST